MVFVLLISKLIKKLLEIGYLVNPDSLIDQDAEIYFLLNSRQMELSFEKSVPISLRQDDIFKVGSISFRVLSVEIKKI